MLATAVQEFAGEPGVKVEGRILKNALLLGTKSLNRNRLYRDDVRKQAAPHFVGKSVFVDHTIEEDGKKYYRRPYTELLGTVKEAWNDEDGIRGDVYLAHHPVCESVIKNINDKLPIGGFSPEMDVMFGEPEDGAEIVSNILRVKCIALTSCPATASLVETIIDESTQKEELDEDGKYHKRRALMSEIESILMEIEDEEESSDQKKFLRIHQILGEHLGVFKEEEGEDCEETVKEESKESTPVEETKVEEVQEGEGPEIKVALPPDFITPTGQRLSSKELFQQIWM
ncbi:MAG: hypothetical protein WC479_08985 [Candidatus Izemoplasmatales bacterium]